MLTLLALLLSIPILDYALSPQGDWLQPLGFRDWATVPAAAWVLALGVGFLFAAFTIRGFPAVHATWRELSLLKLVSLWAATGAAIVEEALFRRLVMDGIADAGGNLVLQVFASSVTFGVAHAIWGLIKLDLRVAVSSTIATAAMGAAIALVYIVANRNLAPCIVSHFIITGTIEPGLLISAVTGRW
ncbi:CPBP family glutamic-type intramembrane protease, partial [Acidobacteria bacterium AH-259-A15]|nr:CPBP family glutamic-type intramembrane protease [Acidobacteria bacterium AH-259-A15]